MVGKNRPKWQRDFRRDEHGRSKGRIIESGDPNVDERRYACINKILQFDGSIDFQGDFAFMFSPGVGGRPRRLIDHLIALECLPSLDRIHAIIFPALHAPEGHVAQRHRSRSRSPRHSPAHVEMASQSPSELGLSHPLEARLGMGGPLGSQGSTHHVVWSRHPIIHLCVISLGHPRRRMLRRPERSV